MRISVVIPCKNEEGTIGEIVRRCKACAQEIIVIDGHSSDKTTEIAKECGALVFLDNNKGKGAAIRLGIIKASGEIIVFIDADGSHCPEDIQKLTAPIIAGEYDLVVGSRMRGGSDELHGDLAKFIRMWGSDIITLGINYRFNARLTDSQNGFKAIKAAVARKLPLRENIATIEEEMIMLALKLGFRVGEVPAHEYARKAGKSKLNVSKVALRFVFCWLKNLL